MHHWQMKWDKPWEDRGQRCLSWFVPLFKLSGCSHNSHARLPACKAHLNPIQAHVRRSCTPYFPPYFSNNSIAPSSCSSLSSTLLSHVASLFIVPAVSYSSQEHEQRQPPVDVSRTDCTNVHSAIWHLCGATGGVKLIFMQGCASPLLVATHQIRPELPRSCSSLFHPRFSFLFFKKRDWNHSIFFGYFNLLSK